MQNSRKHSAPILNGALVQGRDPLVPRHQNLGYSEEIQESDWKRFSEENPDPRISLVRIVSRLISHLAISIECKKCLQDGDTGNGGGHIKLRLTVLIKRHLGLGTGSKGW